VGAFLLLWNAGYSILWQIRFSVFFDRDANLKYGAIQAFVYAFTFIGGIFADKVLGFKKNPFGASVILGNLIIAFSPCIFLFGNYTYNYWNRFLQAKYFFNGWELYKVGTVVEMLVLDCFIPELILSIVRGAVCVYLGTSPDYGWSYAFLSAAIVMVIGLITFNNETFLGPHR
jgi:POT family proton-dependent oligopeptide transporter